MEANRAAQASADRVGAGAPADRVGAGAPGDRVAVDASGGPVAVDASGGPIAAGGPPDPVEAGIRFLATMVGCPVVCTDDPEGFLAEFEQRHCFDARLQPAFTAAHLADFTRRMDPRVIHELHEPLEMYLTVFRLGEQLVVVGPYTRRALRVEDVEELLGRLRIPGSYLQLYRLYRSRYAIVDSEYVMRGAIALAQAAVRAVSDFGYERVEAEVGPLPGTAGEPPRSAPYAVIDERYAMERDFMDAIAVGDEREALGLLDRMASSTRLPGQYLNDPYLGATILRILVRVAAQEAGLPPVTIDAVSQTYAQRLHRSGHIPDSRRTGEAIADMVTEFCRHIRRHRRRPYSAPVRAVMDEIDLHLGHAVSPGDLARRLHMSPSHLARRFKAETGGTIGRFAARRRVEVAARLLATTSRSVQDVAAYVGYLDANYFVKVFRSVHGLTPTQFRRAAAEGGDAAGEVRRAAGGAAPAG